MSVSASHYSKHRVRSHLSGTTHCVFRTETSEDGTVFAVLIQNQSPLGTFVSIQSFRPPLNLNACQVNGHSVPTDGWAKLVGGDMIHLGGSTTASIGICHYPCTNRPTDMDISPLLHTKSPWISTSKSSTDFIFLIVPPPLDRRRVHKPAYVRHTSAVVAVSNSSEASAAVATER